MLFVRGIWSKIKPIVKNKYLLSIIVFVVFLLFFDQHDLISRIKTRRNIKHLEREISICKERIKADKERLKELQSDDENLEKFAREQYLMKKENEDVYLVEE